MKGLLPLSLLGVKVESLEYNLLINIGWKTTVKFLFPVQYIVSLKLRLSERAAFLSQFYAQGIVAKGVKISTDQFFPQKISTKKALFFACFCVFSPVFLRAFPKN